MILAQLSLVVIGKVIAWVIGVGAGVVGIRKAWVELDEHSRRRKKEEREEEIERMVRSMQDQETELKFKYGTTVWPTTFYPGEGEDPELFKEALRRYEQERNRN